MRAGGTVPTTVGVVVSGRDGWGGWERTQSSLIEGLNVRFMFPLVFSLYGCRGPLHQTLDVHSS